MEFGEKGLALLMDAKNGKMKAAKYEEPKPNIFTVKMVLDNMSGIEVIKSILSLDPDARVLMVSAME